MAWPFGFDSLDPATGTKRSVPAPQPMERYYDAHLYVTNWGTHQVMLRLPRTLLGPEVAEQYCIDPHVAAWVCGEHLILDVTSEDEGGD